MGEVISFIAGQAYQLEIGIRQPPLWHGLVGFLGAAGAIVAVANFIRAWTGQGRGLGTRLHDALLLLACLGYVWLAFSLNLLHWNLHY